MLTPGALARRASQVIRGASSASASATNAASSAVRWSHGPDAVGQRLVRIPRDRELVHVGAHVFGAVGRELACAHQAAQGVKDLDVDQMRGVQIAVLGQPPDQSGVRFDFRQRGEQR